MSPNRSPTSSAWSTGRTRRSRPRAYQLAAELRDELRAIAAGSSPATDVPDAPRPLTQSPVTAVAVGVDTGAGATATARATGAAPTSALPAAVAVAAGAVAPPPRTPPAGRKPRRFRRAKTTYPKVAKAPKPVKPLKPPKPRRRGRWRMGAQSAGPPAPPPPKQPRNWKARHWGAVLAAPLLLIVGGVVAYAKITEHAPIVAVPDVVDHDVFSAAAAMRSSGFEIDAVLVDSPRPGGIILKQSPANGAQREQGTAIRLVVSRTTATVPDVVGLGIDEARGALARRGLLDLSVTPDYRDDVDPGTVMSSSPAAYLKAKKSEPLQLVVAADPHLKVPNVVGLDQAAATVQLQNDGLEVAVQTASSKSAPAGQVLKSSPGADQTVLRGSTVTLTVSSGPKLVNVPAVVGFDRGDAISELEHRGFAVTVTTTVSSSADDGTVVAQDPVGGRAPEGSTVTITVGVKAPKKSG